MAALLHVLITGGVSLLGLGIKKPFDVREDMRRIELAFLSMHQKFNFHERVLVESVGICGEKKAGLHQENWHIEKALQHLGTVFVLQSWSGYVKRLMNEAILLTLRNVLAPSP